MIYKYNIPFIAERSVEPPLREWLDAKASQILGAPEVVVEVAEVIGDPQFVNQVLNISWQYQFPTLMEAKEWGESHFPIVAQALAEKFGEDVMSFPTILAEEAKGV